jgi:squalene-hopene/tetraprenyl-beta-curcumene cyclase
VPLPVWDTAINLVALLESGVDPRREEVRRAIAWLESKEVRQRGDWYVNNPGVEPSGGHSSSTTPFTRTPTTP